LQNQTSTAITDRHYPTWYSAAQLLAVIRTISPVSEVNPFQTYSTALLTWSALPITRLAKWRCFCTENSVSIRLGCGQYGCRSS